MKIKEMIISVAKLVEEQEIIDHGSIRCLHSDQAVREIESAEGCESVDTGTVGDNDLASKLSDLAENDREGGIEWSDLEKLEAAFRGKSVTDYLDEDNEDNLIKLDALIDAARELV